MQTSTKLDKYRPNTRANIMMRHMRSPACHVTVIAQPISRGIINSVTSKSATAKCVNIVSIRDGRFMRRLINITSTVILPIDDSTIRMLEEKFRFCRFYFVHIFPNGREGEKEGVIGFYL